MSRSTRVVKLHTQASQMTPPSLCVMASGFSPHLLRLLCRALLSPFPSLTGSWVKSSGGKRNQVPERQEEPAALLCSALQATTVPSPQVTLPMVPTCNLHFLVRLSVSRISGVFLHPEIFWGEPAVHVYDPCLSTGPGLIFRALFGGPHRNSWTHGLCVQWGQETFARTPPVERSTHLWKWWLPLLVFPVSLPNFLGCPLGTEAFPGL